MRKKMCVFAITTLLFCSLGFSEFFNLTSYTVSGIEVSGPIIINTVWTNADSPYFITGNITINNGANLTIQQDVDIYYNGSYSIRVLNGNISAIGTKNFPISFYGTNGAPILIDVINDNNAEFDWCEFVGGNEAIKLQNNEYRTKICNSSFFNCARNFNLTNSKVNVTSTWFDSVHFEHSSNLSTNLMKVKINDVTSQLFIQYFVNIETVNGTNDPLSDIFVNLLDNPPRNNILGQTDLSGRFDFKPITSILVNGTLPSAHFDYENNITVWDKWDGTSREISGISSNFTLIENASIEPKDANLYINKKFMFRYPPKIDTQLSNVLVYEDVQKSVVFTFFDNDDLSIGHNNITVNITDEDGRGIYGTNTKDKWIYWTNNSGGELVFDRSIESPWSPPPPNDFNAIVYEPIYITVMDDDGLKDKIGPVNVEFHNVPDKPEIDGIPAAANITEVTEDVPIYLPIIVSDDDNATKQIKVTTSSEYVSYIFDESKPDNQSLKLLYPNEFGINGKIEVVYVNATDGCWNKISNGYNDVTYSYSVRFHQTPDPPRIVGTIPNKYGTEESWESDLSLGKFAIDPDPDDDADELKWYVTGLDEELYGKKLFSVSNENATANAPLSFNLDSRIDIGGARNPRQITEKITIWLMDRYGLTDHQNIKLVVNSTNQPPSLHKVDKNGEKMTVVPKTGLTSDTFIYEVEYRDLDDEFGDKPEFVKVYIDGKPYNMTEENPADTNFKDGKVYVFEISNLSAGLHYHYFECSDTAVKTRLPAITQKPNFIEGPQVESRFYILEKKSPDQNFTMRFAHPSLKPNAAVTIAKKPVQELEPGTDQYNKTLGDIGSYFKLETGNIEYILWLEITVEFGANYDNYNTTWLRKDDLQVGYFLNSKNEWIRLSFSTMDTNKRILNCNLSQFTGQQELLEEMVNSSNIPVFTVIGFLDADGDNVFNQRDAFPFDPAASIDTDSDGSPDSWHPGMTQKHSTTGLHLDAFRTDPAASVDDDKDGCPDAWNPGKSREDSTTPLDLDRFLGNPGACLDTDGDGLPDQLIPDKNTQPNLVEDSDDDNDGMPDWWEDEWYQYAIDNNLTHFFNSKNASDADEDWDGDKRNNKKEYQERSNPFKKNKDVSEVDADANLYYIIIALVIIAVLLVILFLYTKMRRDQLLEHKVRAEILDHINDNPGIHYRKILNDLDLQMGVATHHLNMLERQKYIKSFQDSNYRRFYPINAPIKTGLILSNVQEKILILIRDNPGVSQSELARRLNLARKVVNYHIKILSDANFVEMETEGRKSQLYYLNGLEFKKAPPRRKKARYKDT